MRNSESNITPKRYNAKIFGIVQGVGFRPYVYNTAKKYNIKGWVNNSGSCLIIDFEGIKKDIKGFILELVNNPPYLAKIQEVTLSLEKYIGYEEFDIKDSVKNAQFAKFIPVDMSVCKKCMEEVFNKNSKYYRYPFTNCTECGPRYTILNSLPYDRQNTTMYEFEMCQSCKYEYKSPSNRRFHAQTVCCNQCGPTYRLVDRNKNIIDVENSIVEAAKLLRQGSILAIKGIGGFHLVCDATNENMIRTLRLRKNRPDKPLAIMVRDLESVIKLCDISETEKNILSSDKKPIVLLKKRYPFLLPENVVPYQSKLGVMLPYTPLHYLIFDEGLESLIMTSGNVSGSPIQYKNEEAFNNLHKIADYFLIHDREINIPVDDSVTKIVNGVEIVVRRGRGYSPFFQQMKSKVEAVALGAEEKSSFSLSQNGYGYMSQYIGDLKDLEVFSLFKKSIKNIKAILGLDTNIFAHDLHRSYLSSTYADMQQGTKIPIQHHHAHMASCMAEHSVSNRVIGIIYDGTGLGLDGNVWGAEFFVGSIKEFDRVGHMRYVNIQGGDSAIKEPWKIAVSYLYSLGVKPECYLTNTDAEHIRIVESGLENNINCFNASSMGRLFDCVAVLIGIRNKITYEAQAAIELENILDASVKEDYRYDIIYKKGVFEIDYRHILYGILRDIELKISKSVISAKFHNTIINMTVKSAIKIRELYNLNEVVLSGGVFENTYLLENICNKLKNKGFTVYHNQQIPINDSGISFGQLAIAQQLVEEV